MAKTLAEVIDTVKKLLALSTSSNANEAAAAAAKANQLIDKFRLSQADLETSADNDPIAEDSSYIYRTGRTTVWKERLIHTLTRHYGVAYYHKRFWDNDKKYTGYYMVGRKSDMAIVAYMFSWLSVECERLAGLEAKGTGRGRSDGKIFAASYQEGFVAGVNEQLKLSREEVKKEATSSAIIKIDSRFQESRNEMYSLIPSLKTVAKQSFRHMDGNAFSMGKKQGQSIHLGAAMATGAGIRSLNK